MTTLGTNISDSWIAAKVRIAVTGTFIYFQYQLCSVKMDCGYLILIDNLLTMNAKPLYQTFCLDKCT